MILALGVCGDDASAAANYYQARHPNCQASHSKSRTIVRRTRIF